MKLYKNGFTLVEIIVCVAIIGVIGVGSFAGVSIVQNKQDIDSLNSMKDKIYSAVEVYLEKNEEAKDNLYNKKNGAVIPLSVLENEGLIDFGKIDIEKKYIVAALGSTKYLAPPVGGETCLGVGIVNSWDDGDKEIYLCGNNIDLSALEARITALEQKIIEIENDLATKCSSCTPTFSYPALPKVYYGNTGQNYISINDKKYRIFYINVDKTITIYNYEKFTGFTEKQIEAIGTNRTSDSSPYIDINYCSSNRIISESFRETFSSVKNVSGTLIDADDIANTVKCTISGTWPEIYYFHGYEQKYYSRNISFASWLIGIPGPSTTTSHMSSTKQYENDQFCEGGFQFWQSGAGGGTGGDHSYIQCGKASSSSKGYKLKLKSCMKIISGTGTYADPYKIKDDCK